MERLQYAVQASGWLSHDTTVVVVAAAIVQGLAHSVAAQHTLNPALLASSFVWQIQLSLLHISLFKVIKRKYISQGKCEFVKFLFVLLDKIKILTL
jgi:hypothetical protein